MHIKNYLGDLSGGSLLIPESRIIAEIHLLNPTEDEWKNIIVNDNVLQKKSPQTALRFANVIRKRFYAMGYRFTESLLEASERAYIQLLFASFMNQSPVVIDFMSEYLAESKRLYKPSISNDAWMMFINERYERLPELSSYSESTLKRMGNNVIKSLVDVGLLKSTRDRQLQAIYVLPETEVFLMNSNNEHLIAMMECTQ